MGNALSKLNTIIDQFKRNEADPIYFISGNEHYFAHEIVSAADKYLIDPASKDFNLEHFYPDESDGRRILSACLALPMMSTRRLVVVHNLELFKISDPERFIRYIEKPEPSSILILLSDKIDKRKKFFSKLIKRATFIDASPLNRESDVFQWINNFVQGQNKRIEGRAVRLLYEHIGNDLFELRNQLNKLLTYISGDREIRVSDIEMMTGISREFNSFELVSMILARNKKKAIRILKHLLEQGEDVIRINWVLFFRFNKQWQCHQLIAEKKTRTEITKQIGISPFFIQDYINPTRYLSLRQISKGLQIIAEMDHQLKSTGTDPKLALEFTVQKLLNL